MHMMDMEEDCPTVDVTKTFLKKFNLIEAMGMMATSWESVKSTTLNGAWHNLLDDYSEEIVEVEIDEDWLNVDQNDTGYGEVDENTIFDMFLGDVVEEEPNLDEGAEQVADQEESSKIQHRDAVVHLEKALEWANKMEDTEPAHITALRLLREKAMRLANQQRQLYMMDFVNRQ